MTGDRFSVEKLSAVDSTDTTCVLRSTVSLSDVRLSYLDTGGPQPALLLLHGAFLSHRTWHAQIRAFREHYRVIAPDLRGHGHSQHHGGMYSVEQFAQDMVVLLGRLGVRQTHVCGHSLGGMVAMQLALMSPSCIQSVVLADTSYGTRSTPLDALLTDLTQPLFRWLPVKTLAPLFAQSLTRRTPDLYAHILGEVLAYAERPEAFRAIWKAVTAFDFKARLPELQAPTLVLVGEAHRQTHAQGRVMTSLLPQAQFQVLPGAGHLLNLEQPAAFNAAVRQFLGRHVGTLKTP